MELQHIIWSWNTLTRRLSETDPDVGLAVFRSCRPIAAQRYRDGRLLVVLGSWLQHDLDFLDREPARGRLSSIMGKTLSEAVVARVVRWPGGMAPAGSSAAEGEPIPAPDVLEGIPQEDREEASKCESAIQRLFYARAYARGLRPRCQYPLLNYRLDFALPELRIGAEVIGWDWRTGPSGASDRREREEQLEYHGWRILLFSGSQVLSNADRCVSDFAELSQGSFVPGQQPLPTRYAPEGRKPFSSLGTHRSPDREKRGPKRSR